mgnify:CR=1 FL=1
MAQEVGQNIGNSKFLLISGEKVLQVNKIEKDGIIHHLNKPMLRLFRTRSKISNGTVLVVPGGDFSSIHTKQEGIEVARFLTKKAYDVVVLDYHIGTESNIQNLAGCTNVTK